jgi:steroid 5-alpha reductase family enzyme
MFNEMILWGLLPKAVILVASIALVVSALGFRRYVFFIGVCYGYSIAVMALASLFLAGPEATAVTRVEAVLLALYGLRLGTFLAIRDGKSGYRASVAKDGDRPADIAFASKLPVWIGVTVFYTAMFLPLLSRFASESRGLTDPFPVMSIVGSGVTALGVALEATADAQKSNAKKKSPARFCDSGLYRFSRCPNYFGEILVWTGSIMAGSGLLVSWLSWIIALIGYVSIVFVMVGAARRLKIAQESRYGTDSEFRAYAQKTPLLVPFIHR